jgi:hypothetical protein
LAAAAEADTEAEAALAAAAAAAEVAAAAAADEAVEEVDDGPAPEARRTIRSSSDSTMSITRTPGSCPPCARASERAAANSASEDTRTPGCSEQAMHRPSASTLSTAAPTSAVDVAAAKDEAGGSIDDADPDPDPDPEAC